jgi:hypothetical protein
VKVEHEGCFQFGSGNVFPRFGRVYCLHLQGSVCMTSESRKEPYTIYRWPWYIKSYKYVKVYTIKTFNYAQHFSILWSALKMETVCFPKRWYLPTSPHSVKTQNNIDIFTAVRTSRRTFCLNSPKPQTFISNRCNFGSGDERRWMLKIIQRFGKQCGCESRSFTLNFSRENLRARNLLHFTALGLIFVGSRESHKCIKISFYTIMAK